MAQPRKRASSDFIRFFSARPADRRAFSVERRGSFRMSARMKNRPAATATPKRNSKIVMSVTSDIQWAGSA